MLHGFSSQKKRVFEFLLIPSTRRRPLGHAGHEIERKVARITCQTQPNKNIACLTVSSSHPLNLRAFFLIISLVDADAVDLEIPVKQVCLAKGFQSLE